MGSTNQDILRYIIKTKQNTKNAQEMEEKCYDEETYEREGMEGHVQRRFRG